MDPDAPTKGRPTMRSHRRTDRSARAVATGRDGRAGPRPLPRLLVLLATSTLVAGAAACQPPPLPLPLPLPAPVVVPTPQQPWAFAEEFTGASLATGRWHPNRWFAATCAAGATSDEEQWYRPGNVAVRGGALVLTARSGTNRCAEGTWGGSRPYSSGWVQTGGSRTWSGDTAPGFTFRFGRIDVRFKAPAGRGLWPAIWLLSTGTRQGDGSLPYPERPEIDGLELFGRTDRWSFNVHLTTPDGPVDQGRTVSGPDTATGWHVLSVDWRSDRITWMVDGATRWTYTGPGIPQVPLYVILNLAVGGVAGTPDPAAFPAELLVDYVRISP